jgi:hypothetical protein
MRKEILLSGICALAVSAGCNSDTPTAQGVLVTFDTVCDTSNEGKRVALEGFLNFPSKFNAKAPSIVMRLQGAPTRTSKVIGASFSLNAGSNTIIAPPDKYNENDLKAITHDGKSADYTTRVKVTGVVSYSNSLDSLAFKCLITNTRLEIAGVATPK